MPKAASNADAVTLARWILAHYGSSIRGAKLVVEHGTGHPFASAGPAGVKEAETAPPSRGDSREGPASISQQSST